ncbi:glycine cleavage system protein GcvH [Goodfellowiella coeruleoviolacea]|uniref:Glycine cleavage system H protein n=1 Tax=Goodfellowiella coeruleoviolacea TaxID=334858 RepID=A0AAE3KDA7_9PSEU|nr:glycine cleavage system protein GcvH [Goodfellowiella coeruleoviolacea]MCP2163836.1 glycine cleavage system H protein [Goodfellowiella coeruleoviolacea]
MVPEELKYTQEHEWVVRTDDGADKVRIGITDFAQRQLGDVVFVQLPEVGETVKAGQALGEVESTKSVSDIYAPLDGEVVARNDALDQQPDLVNSDPYGAGWLVVLKLSDPSGVDQLLDAQAYRELAEQE